MNYFFKKDGKNINSITLIIFICLLFSNSTVFGQSVIDNEKETKSEIVNTTPVEMSSIKQDASIDSKMNFILWFMGSKQSPNSTINPHGTNTKKEFMTSGTEPNRLLIKAFLKKAVSYFENSTV